MTKVLRKLHNRGIRVLVWGAIFAVRALPAGAQPPGAKPAEELYLELGRVGLDRARVYRVRDAALERSAIHITLEDGTIGFTEDVMGKITGAFFEGYGEVLLSPPNEVERRSMSLFTGMAILEERFETAYFRFNDDVRDELKPGLRAAENQQEFVDRWQTTAQALAQTDAMRLLVSFSRMLPVNGKNPPLENPNMLGEQPDRLLHARLQGVQLGVFDVLFDTLSSEPVVAGQTVGKKGTTFYDIWTSFSPNSPVRGEKGVHASSGPGNPSPREDWIAVESYKIRTEVQPPKQIQARARVQLEVKEGGTRDLIFELSRFLQVEGVKLDGEAVEFIHNAAVEGTQLARRGNDIVAVILPEPARKGQTIDLEFVYGGEVLAEAGSGLLYVGEHGTWYPNRGMAMADFDLEFGYPQEWTLVATGKPAPVSNEDGKRGEKVSRWVSERPIPLAGFNLGKYVEVKTHAGPVTVETYAAKGVERDFPQAQLQLVEPIQDNPVIRRRELVVPDRPSPAQMEAKVGEAAARAIQYYAERFGPFPYSHLALTQMPGRNSQGWPGLVFLSSFAFLDDQQRRDLHYPVYTALLEQSIPAHEAAHQWWGDLVSWSSYRDQWFSEGLANYCALMMMQEKDPAGFRQVMEKYRQDLLEKNKDGVSPMEAGPVTLGSRLLSSHFPDGYEEILYGRGTWLFHMLRTMLKDGAQKEDGGEGKDEPFIRGLHKLRQRYEGKSISTRELLKVFSEDLPVSLRYEGKNSLEWFLDGWVNGISVPKLELKSVKFTPKGSGLSASGTILQKDAPDNLVTSVPVYAVRGKQRTLLGRVFADGEESTFHLAAPAGTHKIVLDPNETVLTNPE